LGDPIVEDIHRAPENLSLDCILFRSLLSEGKTEQALEVSKSILDQSRILSDRQYETEAWIRMERALLGACKPEDVGPELRWCVDRLASVSPGSAFHGISLLNLAAWHLNNGEEMMALVTLSDISSKAGHPNDVVGLSRLESGRILRAIGDNEPAMRHLWTAMRRLSSDKMSAEAMVCGMEWLDIALDEVDKSAALMDDKIANAKPREKPGMTTSPSNPKDIREVVEGILSSSLSDLSGETRDDLGLVLDASEIIGEKSWRESMESRIKEIQDSRLLDVLQS
tara:strand:+ start:1953 stop:2798 length:846 start_codon:yes stop_codon:yes gene_type:complete